MPCDTLGQPLTLADSAVMPKDDPGSATLCLYGLTDDQGREALAAVLPDGQVIAERTDQVFDQAGNEVSYVKSRSADESQSLPGSPGFPETRGTVAHRTQTFWWRVPNGQGGYGPWMDRPLSESDYTYDANGQRLTNTNTQPVVTGTGAPQYTGGSPQVDQFGNVTNEVTGSRTEQYTYDALSRLSTVDYGDGETQGYTFDAMGNRLRVVSV